MIAAGFLALFLLGYAAIHLIVRTESFRARVQSELSARSGYAVQIESLGVTPWLGLVGSNVIVSKNGAVLLQGKRIVGFILPFDLYHKRIRSLSLEQPRLRLSLQDLFRSTGKTSPAVSIGRLKIDDGEIVLQTGEGEPFALRAIFLSASEVNLGGRTGMQLRADLPGLNGSVALSLSGGAKEKQVELLIRQGEAQSSTSSTRKEKPPQEKTVLNARFRLTARENDTYETSGAGRVDGLHWRGEIIEGEFDSRFDIGANLDSVTLSMDLKTPQFPVNLLPMTMPLNPGAVSAALRGRYSAAQKIVSLQKISVASSLGVLTGEGAIALGENPARLTAKLRLRDVALDSLKPLMPEALRALTYGGKVAADLSLAGAYNEPTIAGLAWNDGARAAGEKVSLGRLSFKIPFQWAGGALRAKAARLQAQDLILGRKGETQFRLQQASLLGEVVKTAQQPLEASADFQITAGRFATADESKIGEHLNAKGRFTCRDCAGDASFKGATTIESLELLWNKFFGDFKDRKPAIEIAGRYQKTADELRFDRLGISLDAIGNLALIGSVRRPLAGPVFGLDLQSDDLRPAGFYDFFIRDTFKAAYPMLGQIGLGGKSSLALRVQGSLESFTVEGKLGLEQGAIRERAGHWHVGPVALELPLRLSFPAALKENAVESPPAGRLAIDEIKGSSITVPKITAPLVLWNNALRFPQPVRLSIFGGAAAIEGLTWKDIVGAPADLTLSLELDKLRLVELTEALGWHRFDGALSGKIPQVRWTGDALKSDGVITLNVFGGRATIQDVGIEQPFSPARAMKMTAMLDEIDLEQASKTFELGQISGALSGAIEDLVVTHGQPAEFRADLHTVEKPGASQWISVDALNKITILSSGNEAGSLYRGLAGFFDFYRYSKLGFKATLKNDKLTLRGIETRNGQEYLVVGTLLPPTVNIVSHTQEISFSELVRRLERVKQTGGAK